MYTLHFTIGVHLNLNTSGIQFGYGEVIRLGFVHLSSADRYHQIHENVRRCCHLHARALLRKFVETKHALLRKIVESISLPLYDSGVALYS